MKLVLWLAIGLTAVWVSLSLLMLLLVDPNQASPFPDCIFRASTGYLCPGCGATRAVHALLHLEFWRALRMNALLIVSMPIVPLLIARLFRPMPESLDRVLKPLANPWLWGGLYLGFGLLRNLPWAPFSYLAPIS